MLAKVRHVPTKDIFVFSVKERKKKKKRKIDSDEFKCRIRSTVCFVHTGSLHRIFQFPRALFVGFILTLNMADFFPVKPRSCNLRLWAGSERKKYIYGCACFNSCIFSPWLN